MENKEYHGYGLVEGVVNFEELDLNSIQLAEVELDSGLRVMVHRT